MTTKPEAHQSTEPSWPGPTWSLIQNNSCVQIDPTGELTLVLPSAGEHLKKQPSYQTKLGAGH